MLDSNPDELHTQTLIIHAETDTVLGFVPSNPAKLRHAVTQMAAFMNVADWRFLKLISAMDREQSWREGGYCNLSNWLDHQCGIGPCAARERIRIARALEYLPLIDKAFMDCTISYSKVRAITRVAYPETGMMKLCISTVGELIGDTIYPQFQDVSAEFNHQSARLVPLSATSRKKKLNRKSPFEKCSDNELVGMLHSRTDWGAKRSDREWDRIVGKF